MTKYILRLDDASDYMDIEKWERMSALLDKYDIKPIFGIIPQNRDEKLISKYERNLAFWDWVDQRIKKGWTPAMHGYEHRYVTNEGGINPVNKKSEFAGLSYEEQCRKISAGYELLKKHGIAPKIFFAPAHSFDENTLLAIKKMTPIRTISDTIAYDVYKKGDFWFIPQQCGYVRRLPFRIVTFCYHPNAMNDVDFCKLELFLFMRKDLFCRLKSLDFSIQREENVIDLLMRQLYFWVRRGRNH